jgi:putative transposase
MLKVVQDPADPNSLAGSLLDEIVRDGARQMLAAALQAEVAAYVEAHRFEVDDHGRRLVVRNGYHQPREVTTAAGAVPVRQPRINDQRCDPVSGERRRFSSAILPAWSRKSPRVAEVLPLLYLHGLSSSDFGPALEQFLGSAQGLSAATITRLTTQWQDEARAFTTRSLADTDYVYCWVDGIHLKVRLEADKVCLLVIIGVRSDGRKELIALADGFRESSESWADLLRDCRRRGMTAPVLAVGDGALGFWKAVRDVFPETKEQRCWWHKISNVLAALPKSAHPAAKKAIAEIYNAEDKTHALAAAKAFAAEFGVKWPKAAAKITDDLDVLLAFYDYPAEHWIHLRTTNPIESTFATVRLRQRVTKGPGNRAAGIAMAFKLIEAAQARWRMVNAPHLVALVRAGATSSMAGLSNDPAMINKEVLSRQRETRQSTGLDDCSAASRPLLLGSWVARAPAPLWPR